MTIVETIAAAVKPWADWYGHNKGAQNATEFTHIASLVIGGGFAIASDRSALRALASGIDERSRMLRDFATIHRPVIIALTCSAISGVLMLLSDVETFLPNPVFWTKMSCVFLLLTNGYFVKRTEEQLHGEVLLTNPRWRRLKIGAFLSITLWLATTAVGVALKNS